MASTIRPSMLTLDKKPVEMDQYYLVAVPAQFQGTPLGKFHNQVIRATTINHVNGVVEVSSDSNDWLRCGWLHKVEMDVARINLREEVAKNVIRTAAAEVSSEPKKARRILRPRNLLAAAAALLVVSTGVFFGRAHVLSNGTVEATTIEVKQAPAVQAAPELF